MKERAVKILIQIPYLIGRQLYIKFMPCALYIVISSIGYKITKYFTSLEYNYFRVNMHISIAYN